APGRRRNSGGARAAASGPRRGRGLRALEIIAGTVVGLAAVWLILQPLLAPNRTQSPAYDPPDPEETPKGVALAALKEIEFDRETGKLSDEDYAFLKAKYTEAALEA